MKAAGSPLAFPGARTFAGWNRQFSSLHPRVLVAGQLRVVRVESLVQVRREMAADNLCRFLLDAIPDSGEISLHSLHTRMPIALTIFRSVVEKLARADLIQSDSNGIALTTSGRTAKASGIWRALAEERRRFHFLDLRPTAPPMFVRAENWPVQSWSLPIAASDVFGSRTVREELQQSVEWKQRCGFPEEVFDVLDFDSADSIDSWRRVSLAHLEFLSAAVLGVEEYGKQSWLILPANPEGWSVRSLEPILRLPFDAMPVVNMDVWRQSWCNHCRSRQISLAEAIACHLDKVDGELIVRFPETTTDGMKTLREELIKSENWLTADVSNYRFGIRARST